MIGTTIGNTQGKFAPIVVFKSMTTETQEELEEVLYDLIAEDFNQRITFFIENMPSVEDLTVEE